MEARSAGVNSDAEEPLTAELVEWADLIFVMEAGHRGKVSRGFARQLRGKRLVCLGIPDNYVYLDPELVRLLWERVPRSVPILSAARPAEPGVATDRSPLS